MAVLVLDRRQHPLMPCTEKRARLLMSRGCAVVVSLFPFTIRLKDRVGGELQPVRLKLDSGSKFTGIAVVRESESVDHASGEVVKSIAVVALFQLNHRGLAISANLSARSAMRRRRRGNLRYRQARFDNRTKPKGWLAPSLQHRVDTTVSWVTRLQRIVPVTALSQELVRFDMQLMRNPEISGIEYQQGSLQGYEVREYLLEKWGRKCAYCPVEHATLQVEHINPRAKGGSDAVSNLTLACGPCNTKKGTLPVAVFLKDKPEVLARILAQAKKPLRDAAAVNSTRRALAERLKLTGLPLELATGGRTKFNRSLHSIPKTHALDAVCVGDVNHISHWNLPATEIKCAGRGSYQRTLLTKFGFPRSYLMKTKSVHGFQTGDMVKAIVPKGKYAGEYTGRVAVRARGIFNLTTTTELLQCVSHRHCRLISRNNGYGYTTQPRIA